MRIISSKSDYYRYQNDKRHLAPTQRLEIMDLFVRYRYPENPVRYKHYYEEIDFAEGGAHRFPDLELILPRLENETSEARYFCYQSVAIRLSGFGKKWAVKTWFEHYWKAWRVLKMGLLNRNFLTR